MTSPTQAWRRALEHRHGLETIAGYLLKRCPLPGGLPWYLAAYPGPGSYAEALEEGRRLALTDRTRNGGPLALYSIVTVYVCGCTSDDREDGLALLASDHSVPAQEEEGHR